MRRWEKGTRYYQAIVHQDLLGDWVVLKMWGSKLSKLGSHAMEIVNSQETPPMVVIASDMPQC